MLKNLWNSSLLKHSFVQCSYHAIAHCYTCTDLLLAWLYDNTHTHTHTHTLQLFVLKDATDDKAEFLEFEATGSTYSPEGKL